MIRTKFNDNWTVKMETSQHRGEAAVHQVTLPHDGMLYTKRSKDAWNGSKKGYFENGTWTYEKEFEVPEHWSERHVVIEFEGVYNQSMVYINGSFAGQNPYGYTEFSIDAGPLLKYGEKNLIKVIARTGDDSRWYSGAGIYRNVNLLVSEPLYIENNGVRISTEQAGEAMAQLRIRTAVCNTLAGACVTARVKNEIYSPTGDRVAENITSVTLKYGENIAVDQQLSVPQPLLWDVDTPGLYTCKTTLLLDGREMDSSSERFGIRTLELDPVHGLRVNGRSVKLRGTCIHHDNGVIGARAMRDADFRKVRKLKESGFNAIRMAHHPAGRDLLNACDALGMFVMDETFDMWTINKSSQDYALNFPQWWERDVTAMVSKDFNHPSVIMYSIGNEIPDLETAAGSAMAWKIAEKIRTLDPTRYTTHAVNGLLTLGSRMGEVMAEIMPQMMQQAPAEEDGSSQSPAPQDSAAPQASDGMAAPAEDDINATMAKMGAAMKYLTNSPAMDAAIGEACDAVDIAGYNYMIDRYAADKEKYPNRIIVGSETYPRGIHQIWRLVQDHANILGDFTWTGWDYLGEAGIGRLNYDTAGSNPMAGEFYGEYPWITAWCGDCDITGYRLPASYYREIVFGLRKEPYIAVIRPQRAGQTPLISPWSWTDVISSWSFDGYEGKRLSVEVYAPSEEVELFINGRSQGRKPSGEAHEFKAVFEVSYQPGTIEAVAYDGGTAVGSYLLQSAGAELVLDMSAETDVSAEQAASVLESQDLLFVNIRLTDANGNLHVLKDRPVELEISGAGELLGFGSGAPYTEESYVDHIHTTFEGRAFAVIRLKTEACHSSGVSRAAVKITAHAEGCETRTLYC